MLMYYHSESLSHFQRPLSFLTFFGKRRISIPYVGIMNLFHFTDIRDLCSIKKHGLHSWRRLYGKRVNFISVFKDYSREYALSSQNNFLKKVYPNRSVLASETLNFLDQLK